MLDTNELMQLFIKNVKKILFPEEWLDLDLKFSKLELFTLLLLSQQEELTMTELSEHIHSAMSTTTGIVDRLVKNDYLKRERSELDRRIVVIKLTNSGQKVISQLKQLMNRYLSIVVNELNDEEQEFLITIVLKIMNKLQEQQIPNEKEIIKLQKIEIE